MTPSETIPIQISDDVVRVRSRVRALAMSLGLGIVDQTKIVTAASELARNTLQHGGGGQVTVFEEEKLGRKSLRLVFEDSGPGIPDIERALQDGYTTGGGMGLGLSGARRLSNEFSIESVVGRGTRVMIARWK